MAGKRNKCLNYGVEMELDFLCGKINVNERIRRTYIDVDENRYADFAWYGELSRYTIRTSFGELEIEYR